MNLFWYTWGVAPLPLAVANKVFNEILVVTGILGQGATVEIFVLQES